MAFSLIVKVSLNEASTNDFQRLILLFSINWLSYTFIFTLENYIFLTLKEKYYFFHNF